MSDFVKIKQVINQCFRSLGFVSIKTTFLVLNLHNCIYNNKEVSIFFLNLLETL